LLDATGPVVRRYRCYDPKTMTATIVVDILRWALFLLMVVLIVGWLDGLRRGSESLRDEAGRLKPVPAVIVIVAGLIVIGLIVGLIT
jgi:hypothetical protein